MDTTKDLAKGDYDIAVNPANPMSIDEYLEAVKEGWRLHHMCLAKMLAAGPVLYDTSREIKLS